MRYGRAIGVGLALAAWFVAGGARAYADKPMPRPAAEPAGAPAGGRGPAPGGGGGNDRKLRAALRAAEEERRERPMREARAARDRADRLRADYEAANKPGPVPERARGTFDAMVAAFEEAIGRDVSDPRVAEIVAYAHQRLSGAYTYAGRREEGLEVAKAGARRFAGTPEEIEAAFGVGLCYLQSLHRPADALPWFKRAQELASGIAEPQLRTKWLTATSEAINRCERVMGE